MGTKRVGGCTVRIDGEGENVTVNLFQVGPEKGRVDHLTLTRDEVMALVSYLRSKVIGG
jgi:hypothetical protein